MLVILIVFLLDETLLLFFKFRFIAPEAHLPTPGTKDTVLVRVLFLPQEKNASTFSLTFF
mgnify:CR=1 FL=1